MRSLGKRFGLAVAQGRRALGYSQIALAERAGLSPRMIAAIEAGDRVPSFPVAVELSLMLGLDLSAIAAGARTKTPEAADWASEAIRLLRALPEPRRREVMALIHVMGPRRRVAKGKR